MLIVATGVALAAPITVVDDAGPDDDPGQKDLNSLAIDYAPGNGFDIAVTWNWDDTAWSGNNTGDAQALFDTDGDGNANYTLAIQITGTPVAGYVKTTLWSCSDQKADRCTNPNAVISEDTNGDGTLDSPVAKLSTGAAALVAGSDPFGVPASPYYSPLHVDANDCSLAAGCLQDDMVATLNVKLADFGAAAAKLTNVCSFPSGQPGSDPSDCIFTPQNGFLTLVKVANPNDGTPFVFNASEDSSVCGNGTCENQWTINGSGSVQLISYEPTTTLDLNEVVPAGWQLDSASCAIQTASPTGTGTATGTGVNNLEIRSGLETICAFNDSLSNGTLIVKKVMVNDNGGTKTVTDFSFQVNGGAAVAFEADGQNDLTVAPGSYTVTEPSVAGYTTTYDNCSNVTVPAGGSATCTITNNDQPGTLIVRKVVVNDNGGTLAADDFSFSVNGGAAVSFEADGQNDLTVNAGTYSVTEPAVAGYATTYDNCANLVIPNGGTATCAITNNDIQPRLTVIKIVQNNNGGTAVSADFTMSVTGGNASPSSFIGSAAGTEVLLNAGAYTVGETGPSGYSGAFSGDCDATGQGTIAVGETKTCTVTNDDQPGRLKLTKVVVNNNGGNAVATDWTLTAAGPTPLAGAGGAEGDVNAGLYTLGETGPAGYTASAWSCVEVVSSPKLAVFPTAKARAAAETAADTVTVAGGESWECAITNDDQAATLIVKKIVVNDDGGALAADDFSFAVNGGAAVSFEADGQNDLTVDAGTYTVVEPAVSGYTTTYNNCADVVIPNGGTATCTVTNNDQPATLIVKKVVVNDNGGALAADDFSFAVNGGAAVSFEADGQNDLTVDAGTHTVVEPAVSGYTTTYNNCADVVIPNGGTATCTITNNDQPATLIVIKHVINDNGGTKTAADFTLDAGGANDSPDNFPGAEAPGTAVTLDAGAYDVTESGPSGYAASYSADCAGVIANGQTKTCTVTNDDQAGTLIVKKVVVNDNGGTKVAGDFTFSVDGGAAVPFEADGQNDLPVDAGMYDVTEPAVTGYATTYNNCVDVIVTNGGTATCVITNNDIAPKLTVVKYLVPSTDGGKFNLLIDGVVKASNVGNNGTTGAVMLNAGLHTVSETAGTGTSLDNYLAVIGGDCAANGTITLAVGDEKTCAITNQSIKIELDKQLATSASGPWHNSLSNLMPGADVHYRFVVKNIGGADLTNVSVNDPLLGGAVCSVPGTLAAGASYTCSVVGPFDVQYDSSGQFCNTATASGAAGAKTVSDTDTACYTADYWAFTPGFWKNHTPAVKNGHDAWQYTLYHTFDKLGQANVFQGGCLSDYPRGSSKPFSQQTLLNALSFKGGSGDSGAKETLLRAGAAALLNASFHETTSCYNDQGQFQCALDPQLGIVGPGGQVYYPLTVAMLQGQVETATCGTRDQMLALASALDGYNNGIHYINWNDPNEPPFSQGSGSTLIMTPAARREDQ